jgi:hypothetical protein
MKTRAAAGGDSKAGLRAWDGDWNAGGGRWPPVQQLWPYWDTATVARFFNTVFKRKEDWLSFRDEICLKGKRCSIKST